MMHVFDPARLSVFERILARPLPRGLPRGGQIHRWDGDPSRRATRLPGIIMAWLQYRHLEIDAEEPLTARARTQRRPRPAVRPMSAARPMLADLRLLRPTGTA
jgi:hypothetical protein